MFENFNGQRDLCKFSYASGAVHKVSAQVAGEVCAELEAEGRLTARDLVDASRPSDAPMHEEFEWDDEVAAERYRETQAAAVIRHLVIRVTRDDTADDEPKTYRLRAYSSTHETHGPRGTYVYTPSALDDESQRKLILKSAASDAAAFMTKYEVLEEVAPIIKEMRIFLGQEDEEE